MTRVTSARGRATVAAVATLALLAVAVGYVVYAVRRQDRAASAPPAPAAAVSLAPGPRLLVRDARPGPGRGRLATVERTDPAGPRQVSALECERVYAAAATGVCLRARHGLTIEYEALVLDQRLRERARISLPGAPSRARVSPSGRMVSWTVFVVGDSYTSTTMSTRTGIHDTRTGRTVENLEMFAITRDGARFRAADVNFWGVTFAPDDNTFYATLATGGSTYLVRGDFARRTVVTLKENVECPSLSPDATRLVYKKKVSDDPDHRWRLSVLELDSLTETQLAETQSVDDQAVWLDNRTVGYALPQRADARFDVWSVPADGSGEARLLVPDADSPAPLAATTR